VLRRHICGSSKFWFFASTFAVKIATFAKPETVVRNAKKTELTRNYQL
jgi:hypothetical protein